MNRQFHTGGSRLWPFEIKKAMFLLSSTNVDLWLSLETGRCGDKVLGTLSPRRLHHLHFLVPNMDVSFTTRLPPRGLFTDFVYFHPPLDLFFHIYTLREHTHTHSQRSTQTKPVWRCHKVRDRAADRNRSVCRFVNIKTGKRFLVNSSHTQYLKTQTKCSK